MRLEAKTRAAEKFLQLGEAEFFEGEHQMNKAAWVLEKE